ncbi:hypothetical protein BTVI_79033 [Pitangus sulphuratus]|nr:hypothetical protein BTVI_79033 [Pitangus sulphuratus]
MGRGTFRYPRLPQAPSSLALDTSRDGESTASMHHSSSLLRVSGGMLLGTGLSEQNLHLPMCLSEFFLVADPCQGSGASGTGSTVGAGLVMRRDGLGGEEKGTAKWNSPVKQQWRIGESWQGFQEKGRGLRWSLGSENHGNEGVTEEYQLKLKHQERGLGV